MRFVLFYEGPLHTTNTSEQKLAIARQLHPQLRQLWRTNETLLGIQEHLAAYRHDEDQIVRSYIWWITKQVGAFECIPLVTEEMRLRASLDITIFEPSPIHLVSSGGDIDNRVKVLLDSLRVPDKGWVCHASERAKHHPSEDEHPFYCLLEDDAFIKSFRVSTDQLLAIPAPYTDGDAFVRVHISVSIKPISIGNDNWMFLGESSRV